MKLNLEKFNKKNICLVGLMGSGKSLIARKLSKELKFKYYDTDRLIEKKVNKSINQIFEDNDELYFRKIEEEVVLNTLESKNSIISLGGGSILSNLSRKKIKKNSISIYLNVDIEILYKRLIQSRQRPLLKNSNIKEKLIELLNERKKYYNKSDLIINNSNSIEETTMKIINKFKKKYE